MLVYLLVLHSSVSLGQSFSMEDITSYPFPSGLTTSATGSKIAYTVNEKGKRNIYVAEGPEFALRKLTNYTADDSQEITGISISADGKWVVYVRGGDHGAYDETTPRNPSSLPYPPKVQVMSVPFSGGTPIVLSDGDYPQISPLSNKVAFNKGNEIWVSPMDAPGKAERMFYARGSNSSFKWSPDGKKLAFVSSRGDHSFIGVYTDNATPIQWLAPAFANDEAPEWSPDGKKIVFVRRPASGGGPDSITVRKHNPWSIWTTDLASGKSAQIWKAPATLRGSAPNNYNLHWTPGDRIVFMSYHDGWQHLYSMPSSGGTPTLLTKGAFMVEQVKLSHDGKWIIASANTGPDKEDLDRRHIIRVPVDRPEMEILTPGKGIESYPVITGDGASIAMFSATVQRPAVAAIMPFKKGSLKLIGEKLIPADFPSSKLVTPKSVQFKAADGVTVYGQLFEPNNSVGKKPAVVFVHGGPQRQMLVGWHYGDYYSNTYAVNQYLASQGFVVLAVNYRLGIGYGHEFQYPADIRANGAAEYRDVKAAGEWLAKQPDVDPKRLGIYGGSYGGFLTALALGRDSKLFAAGVDIHGVHSFVRDSPVKGEPAPDAELSKKLTWESSPIAWVDTWKSPVLIIHGDDDGNVDFRHSVDLVRRFEKKGVPYESLVLPDETHHLMKYSNTVKVNEAIVEFLKRKLGK
ncbi:MAG: S9 family peptidase [Sphingobacteriaceae bacterium]